MDIRYLLRKKVLLGVVCAGMGLQAGLRQHELNMGFELGASILTRGPGYDPQPEHEVLSITASDWMAGRGWLNHDWI